MKLTKLLPIIGISGTLAASPALMTSCTKPIKYLHLNHFHKDTEHKDSSYLSSDKFDIKKNETVKLTIQMTDWTQYEEWPDMRWDSWELSIYNSSLERVIINTAKVWLNGIALTATHDFNISEWEEGALTLRKPLTEPSYNEDTKKWTPCSDTLIMFLTFGEDVAVKDATATWRIYWD